MKRFISFLLCAAMLFGMVPTTAFAFQEIAEENICDLSLRWEENGQTVEWNIWNNPDDPLPAGLTVDADEESLTITMNGTSLTEMVVWDWGARPVNIIVEGENYITALNWTALDIRCSHNVTISGGGTLNLVSEITPLSWHDYYQQSGDNGVFAECPDGLFTISAVIINARNDYENWHGEEGGRERWDCGAFSFVGGHTLITGGAVLNGDAPNNSGAEGDVTIENGAALNVAGWGMNPRANVNSDAREDWLATLTIAEGGTMNLKKTSDSYDGEILGFACDTELVIDGGVLNLDATDMSAQSDIMYLGQSLDDRPACTATINSGELNITMGNQQGRAIVLWDGTTWTQNGGKLNIAMDELSSCAIAMNNGSTWTQNGGTMTITCDASNGQPKEGMYLQNASYQQYGGTLRFVNTAPEEAHEDNYAVGMIVDQRSSAIFAGGSVVSEGPMGIYIIGDMTVSGGELELDGKHMGLVVERGSLTVLNGSITSDQIWLNSNGSLRMLGGSLKLTDYLNIDHGFARFSGGETTIGAVMGIGVQTSSGALSSAFTLDSGINAVHSLTGKAVELIQDDPNHGYWYNWDGGDIIIKRQSVGSSSFSALMELTSTAAITAGTVASVRLAAAFENPSETVAVKLPEGVELYAYSVSLNGQSAAYTKTADGFTVTMENGQMLRFGVIPRNAGTVALTADIGGNSVETAFEVQAYTLAMYSEVNEPVVRASGTAAPGAVLTFYDGETVIGTVTANALGGWSAELPIADVEGEHSIHAEIALSGGTVTTEPFTVLYDSDCAVLETLTITNTIHGDTDYAPNREVSVVINYKDGTRSQNYYTYWPELPDFKFEAAFEGDTGTPDRIARVWVVGTDYYGVEKDVELHYNEKTGTWIGYTQFCGYGQIVPEQFQVKWHAQLESGEEPEIEPEEPVIPEEVEENYADGAVVTSESLTYTFDLSDDAEGLAVENGAGTAVTVTDNSFTGETGSLYYATLTEGTFEEYDTDSLCILMPAGGENSYEYQENVHETDDGLEVGDILLSGDAAQKITGIEADGSYICEEADLEEVFSQLTIDGLGLPEDGESVIVDEELEAALVETFLETETYAAYQSAVETYAEAKGGLTVEETKVTSKCEYTATVEDHKIILEVNPKISVESKMKANLPDPIGEQDTKVNADFSYKYILSFDLRVYLENKTFEGAAFTVDETTTANLDIKVVVGEEEDEGAAVNLKQFFGEVLRDGAPSAIENYLEKVTTPAEDRQAVTLSKFRVRTNIPFLYIAASVELELEEGFNGELELGAEVSFGQTYGFYVLPDGEFRTFYQQKEFYAMAGGEFHLQGSTAVYLRISVGPQLLNLINGSVYGKIGPKLQAGGHGEATISTRPSENSAEAEFWVGETLEFELGLSAWIRLVGGKREAFKPLCSYSHPLGFIGTNEMPCRFTTVESELYVYTGADLEELVDLHPNYQQFSPGLKTGSKVFDLNDYEYFIDVGPFSIENDTFIKVNDPLNECEGWLKVVYTCPSGNYEITKLIKIKYVPSSIIIQKSTPCCGNLVASFSIRQVENGWSTSVSTPSSGVVVVPVESHKNYVVKEIVPPGICPVYNTGHGYAPEYHEIYVGTSAVAVGFTNSAQSFPDPIISPPYILPSNGDPSGYVYEGIQSNRLEGVTTKLYRSDASNGADAELWNAADFDQRNPLTTDVLGQYQWMVPSGWYQVTYEKDGYETVSSEWMEVPPIRTEVNQNLVSYKPAAAVMTYNADAEAIVAIFDRPVAVSKMYGLTVKVNGEETGASCIAVNGEWSVMEEPEVCATTFLIYSDGFKPDADVAVSMTAVTYAGTESPVSAALHTPASLRTLYRLTVENGTGSGEYEADTEIVIRAEEKPCREFVRWDAENIWVEDETAPETTVHMPRSSARIRAEYTDSVHSGGEGTVTRQPTCTEPGIETFTCQTCGESYTVEIPATGHNYVNGACSSCGDVKLAAPVVTGSNVASTGKNRLKWEAVEGAVKYHIYRATSRTGTYKKLTSVSGTSFTNTSAKAGKTYYYYVAAEAEDGTVSAASNIVTRTCDCARPVVTGSNASSSGKIRLTWEKVEGAVKYQVYRSTSKTGAYKLMKTTTGTSYTNTSAKAGTTYYYYVVAVGSKTAAKSAKSKVVTRTCDLARPEVTVSNAASSGKIRLSWNKVEGAVKYQVYRAASKSGTYSLMKTTTGTSYTNTSAKAGVTYYYKVIAIAEKSAANSAYSEIKSRTCDLPQPDVSITRSGGKPKLTWDKVSGAVSYKVYRSTSRNGTYSLIKTVAGTRFTDTSAKSGRTYYYKVVAVAAKTAANSAYSDAVFIKTK